MIRSFESVYRALETLILDKLPLYIERVNESHTDGVVICPFANRKLNENCAKVPCVKFSEVTASYSEKDRLLESSVFEVCLAVNLRPLREDRIIEFWRYAEALQLMLEESAGDDWDTCRIDRVSGYEIYLRIEVCSIGS